MSGLKDRVVVVTGASRGIGRAIAVRCARDGAKVVLASKTTRTHAKLPGTIHEAARECVDAGGEALAVKCDVRDEAQVAAVVERAIDAFGGIDVVVNNASAISLTGTLDTPWKLYDRMFDVNARGSWAVTKSCLPQLLESDHARVLSISPPLPLAPHWYAKHSAYTLSKAAMSTWVIGMAQEFAGRVAFNALWPRTTIDTAAIRNLLGGEPMARRSRTPAIMADAAHAMLVRDVDWTGHCVLDEEVLAEEGVTDLSGYAVDPSQDLQVDLFVDDGEGARFEL